MITGYSPIHDVLDYGKLKGGKTCGLDIYYNRFMAKPHVLHLFINSKTKQYMNRAIGLFTISFSSRPSGNNNNNYTLVSK